MIKLKWNYKLILLIFCGTSLFALFNNILFGEYFHFEHEIKNCTILEYDNNSNKICDFIKKNNIDCNNCKFDESNYVYVVCGKRVYRTYSYKNYIDYKKYNSYYCNSDEKNYKINNIYRVGIYIYNDTRLNYFYDDDLAIQKRIKNINSIILQGILFFILLTLYFYIEYKTYHKEKIYFMQKKFDLSLHNVRSL